MTERIRSARIAKRHRDRLRKPEPWLELVSMRKGIGLGAAGLLLAGALYSGRVGGNFRSSPRSRNDRKRTGRRRKNGNGDIRAGCFWCVEAVFQDLKGVQSVVSGYAGGTVKNPYLQAGVHRHHRTRRGVPVSYDPGLLLFRSCLRFSGKRTTRRRSIARETTSGPNTVRRFSITMTNRSVWRSATKRSSMLRALLTARSLPRSFRITNYYKAEDYHQNYFNQNGNQAYCQFVIRPKLEKFRKVFHDKLKTQ